MAESHREEIAKLEALYASNPGGRVFVHLAEAYRKGGEHERARRILDEGLARHTDSASGYVVLGRVLADMQVTDEAETAFRRVLELDSGNLVALRWLGDLARQSGRFADAAIYYRDLLTRNPSNEEVRDLVEIVEREAATAPPAAQPEAEAEPVAEGGATEAVEAVEESAAAQAADSAAEAVPGATEAAQAGEPEAASTESAGAETAFPQEEPIGAGAHEPAGDTAGEPARPLYAAPAEAETAAIAPEAPEAAATPQTEAAPSAEPAVSEAAAPVEVPAPAGEVEHEAEAEEPAAAEPEPASEPEPLAPEPYLPEFAAAPLIPDEEPVFAPFVEPPVEEEPEAVPTADLNAPWPVEEESEELAEPFEIQLFDSAVEAEEEEEVPTFEGGIDLSDLAEAAGDELEGEYADDEFLADFMKSSGEALEDTLAGDSLDVLDTGTPLTLLGDEAADAEAETPEEPFTLDLGQSATTGSESDNLEFIEVVDLEETTDVATDLSFSADDLNGLGTEDDEPIELVETFEVFELEESDDKEPAPAAEAAPWSEPDRRAAHPEEPKPAPARQPVRAEAAPMTETMALLYRSQGFHDRAAEVYRALLAQRPGDERLAARLREAEEAAGITPGASPEPVDDEAAGEVWLRGVGAAWPDDSADTTEATPYAWTEVPDDSSRAEPISSFLQDLVAWKQGQSRWYESAVMGLDDEDESQAQSATMGWSPDPASAPASQPADPWLSTGAASETWDPVQEIGREADLAPAEPASGTADAADPWEQTESAAPTPAAGPAGAQPPAVDSAADDSDDEDVEMFRSWLQSLKK